MAFRMAFTWFTEIYTKVDGYCSPLPISSVDYKTFTFRHFCQNHLTTEV